MKKKMIPFHLYERYAAAKLKASDLWDADLVISDSLLLGKYVPKIIRESKRRGSIK